MVNPATASHVADRWRTLTDGETIKTHALLRDAWALLHRHVADLDTRLAANPPTLDPALIIMVEVAMVLRVLRNPEGKSQESIEDYSYTRYTAAASGEMYVSADELALLTPIVASPTGAFTIVPYHDPGLFTGDELWWTLPL